MTVTEAYVTVGGRAEWEQGSHHMGPPMPGQEVALLPKHSKRLGSQGLSQEEREVLAVRPGLETKGGNSTTEPQSQAANMISLSGNRFFCQQRDFLETSSSLMEASMRCLGTVWGQGNLSLTLLLRCQRKLQIDQQLTVYLLLSNPFILQIPFRADH